MAKRISFCKVLCFAGIIVFVNPSNLVGANQYQQGMNTGIGGFSEVLELYYSSLPKNNFEDSEETVLSKEEIVAQTFYRESYDGTIGKLIKGACTGDELIEYACRFTGNPYKWGGTSLTKGTDCSGFVQSVYKHFGISLDRVSRKQAKTSGKKVELSLSALQPGDLIFYAKGSKVNHVAIYIGDGKVVHAAGKKYGIIISDYDYRKPFGARRVLSD